MGPFKRDFKIEACRSLPATLQIAEESPRHLAWQTQ